MPLQGEPGVPQTGWRAEHIEDLGGPDEICEWCPYNKHIRFVHVMSHPDWADSVRVGWRCAELMGDSYAGQREREFRRNPDLWLTQVGNSSALIDSERSTVRDRLQRVPAPSRQDLWAQVFWFLVVFALIVYFNRP
jgi:hypothetical protein